MERKVDALIIGGGIIGLSIGYYLSKKGFLNVEIVEKESLFTTCASGHNAGGISSPQFSERKETWEIAKASSKLFQELGKDFQFDYRMSGTIVLIPRGERIDYELESFRSATGVAVEQISLTEVKEKEPWVETGKFSGGIFYPNDAQANSKKLGAAFAKVCLTSGLRLSPGTAVLGFETVNGRILSTITNQGKIYSNIVVLAAGPWSGKISSMLGLKIPIEPVKGHLIHSRICQEKILNTFILGPKYYLLQDCDGRIVVGGGEDRGSFATNTIGSRIREAWKEAVLLFPRLKDLGIESTEACLRPFAPDELPVIGSTITYSNLIIASGHFRHGLSLAPITGLIVSELIVDKKSSWDLRAFCPDRFN